jgi:hypothetical protein
VLKHFERILWRKRFIEAITRADMDDFITGSYATESAQQ